MDEEEWGKCGRLEGSEEGMDRRGSGGGSSGRKRERRKVNVGERVGGDEDKVRENRKEKREAGEDRVGCIN